MDYEGLQADLAVMLERLKHGAVIWMFENETEALKRLRLAVECAAFQNDLFLRGHGCD